jgi:N-acetylneuraminic acid mutarotase
MHRAIYTLALVTPVLFLLSETGCHPVNLPYTQTGNWLQSAQIGSYPRTNAVSFVIGNKAYVGTGYNPLVNGNKLSDFWRFSVDSGWKQVQSLPGSVRSNAVGFSLNGHGYVGTGLGADGVTSFNDFYQYDTLLNQWTQKSSFPGGPRRDAVGFGLQGKGYIGTGFSFVWLNDFYEYDPGTDSWALTVGTSGDFSKRQAATCFVHNNKAYIVAGSANGTMARDFWSFDPSLSSPWVRLGDITNDNSSTKDDQYSDIRREYAVSFINGDSAYLTLGQNGVPLASTWVYDFVHDQWAQRTPYHREPRTGAVAFTISGRSFVGTGNAGSAGVLDDFDEFMPNQPYNPND